MLVESEAEDAKDENEPESTFEVPKEYEKYCSASKKNGKFCKQQEIWLKILRDYESAAPSFAKVIRFLLTIP